MKAERMNAGLGLKLQNSVAGELAVVAKLYLVASLPAICRSVQLRLQRKENLLFANLTKTVVDFLRQCGDRKLCGNTGRYESRLQNAVGFTVHIDQPPKRGDDVVAVGIKVEMRVVLFDSVREHEGWPSTYIRWALESELCL